VVDRRASTVLEGGRWVQRGGVRYWVDDDNRRTRHGDTLAKNANSIRHLQAQVARLEAVRDRLAHENEQLRKSLHGHLQRHCCDECGCLVMPGEKCPQCLWLETRQEVA